MVLLQSCNNYKTTPCFFVEIESECHEKSTRVHYEVSSKEFQRITSFLKSNDPNYYSSEECMHITFKTKEGSDVSGYFVSFWLCD
jgi:hypothetical protein